MPTTVDNARRSHSDCASVSPHGRIEEMVEVLPRLFLSVQIGLAFDVGLKLGV